MYQLADVFFAQVDALFENDAARLVWSPATYGRALGLAGLGHLCNYLEVLQGLSIRDEHPFISSLVKRHCDESWATGVCLYLGDESDVRNFFGQASRMEDFQLTRRQELIELGALPSVWPSPPRQFEGVDVGSWKYEEVFARAAQLLEEAGVLRGAAHIYDTVYRPLSNQLGAHPTPYVFDPYVSRGSLFIKASRVPDFGGRDTFVPRLPSLNFIASFLMAVTYALGLAQRLDVDARGFESTLATFERLRETLKPRLDSDRRTR